MSQLLDSVAELLGREPRKKPRPDEIAPEITAIHKDKHDDKSRIEKIKIELAHKAQQAAPEKLRRKRWAVLIIINLLFVASFQLDIQMLEGALTASRFVGFHMADLNSTLQVMLAYKHVVINLVIGTATVFIGWWLLGGRTFCSWV